MAVLVGNDDTFADFLCSAGDKVVVVKFYSESDVLYYLNSSNFEVAKECFSGVKFISVCVDKNPFLKEMENISATPTYVMYKKCSELGRIGTNSILGMIKLLKSVIGETDREVEEKQQPVVKNIHNYVDVASSNCLNFNPIGCSPKDFLKGVGPIKSGTSDPLVIKLLFIEPVMIHGMNIDCSTDTKLEKIDFHAFTEESFNTSRIPTQTIATELEWGNSTGNTYISMNCLKRRKTKCLIISLKQQENSVIHLKYMTMMGSVLSEMDINDESDDDNEDTTPKYGLIETKWGIKYNMGRDEDESPPEYVVIIIDSNILTYPECNSVVLKIMEQAEKERTPIKVIFPWLLLHEIQVTKDYLVMSEKRADKVARKTYSNIGGRFLRRCLKFQNCYLQSDKMMQQKETECGPAATADEIILRAAMQQSDICKGATTVLLTLDRILQLFSGTYMVFSYEVDSVKILLEKANLPIREILLANPVFINEEIESSEKRSHLLIKKRSAYFLKCTVKNLKQGITSFWKIKNCHGQILDPMILTEIDILLKKLTVLIKEMQMDHFRLIKVKIDCDKQVPENVRHQNFNNETEVLSEQYDHLEDDIICNNSSENLLNKCCNLIDTFENHMKKCMVIIDSQMLNYPLVRDIDYEKVLKSIKLVEK